MCEEVLVIMLPFCFFSFVSVQSATIRFNAICCGRHDTNSHVCIHYPYEQGRTGKPLISFIQVCFILFCCMM